MINLTGPNITFNPVNRWRLLSFDYDGGTGIVEVQSAGGAQVQSIAIVLSDVAGKSTGVKVNATYTTWGKRFIPGEPGPGGTGGMGLANALTNARTAYDNQAGNHNAKMHAVELQALTDQWVDAALTGT
jgi:hypothetical protein